MVVQIPTINGVAKKAGVSIATVSRVINSPERVTQAVRQRVLQVDPKPKF